MEQNASNGASQSGGSNTSVHGDCSWGWNDYSCKCKDEYEKVHQCISVGLNVDELFQSDALHMNSFQSSQYAADMEVVYYAYLALVERVNDYITKKKNSNRNKVNQADNNNNGAGKKKKNRRARPVRLDEDEAMEDNNADEEEQDGEQELQDELDGNGENENELNDDDAGSNNGDGGNNNNNNSNGGDPDLEERTTDNDKVELFMESVLSKAYASGKLTAEHSSGLGKITDYRYFFNVYSENIDVNKIWADMINEIIKNNLNAKTRGNKRKKTEIVVQPKQYDKWKGRIFSKKNLAEILDSRMGVTRAVNLLAEVDNMPLANHNNPVCATQFFSPFITIDCDSSKKGRILQRKNDNYLGDSMEDYTVTLKFPDTRFVYRISLSEMRVHNLYNKIIPHQQLLTTQQLSRMLPFIMDDGKVFRETKHIPEDSELLEDPNYKEKLDKARQDEEGGGEAVIDITAATAASQDKMEVDEEEEDKEERELRSSNAKNRAASAWGFKNFDANTIKKSDKSSKRINLMTDLVNQIIKIPSITNMYLSAYGPLRQVGMRNLNLIKRDFNLNSDAASGEAGVVNTAVKILGEKKYVRAVGRILYRYNQDWLFDMYKKTCRNPNSNISPTGRKIMQWVYKEKAYENHGIKHDKVDKNLNSFVNQEIRLYAEWEIVYLLNHSHRIMNLYHKNSLDAYCMDFSRPHQSLLLVDENGGGGKSYMGSVLGEIRIPDTIELITFESLKCRATDEPQQNDSICIFDELEKNLIDKDAKNNDKERAFKLLLSMNKVMSKFLFIDEEGNRKTKITYAECITVFFANTNSNLNCMSSAMARRWHVGYVDERLGMSRNITDIDLFHKILSDEERCYKDKLNREHRIVNALVFEIEKLIYIGALSEVIYAVPMIVLFFISNEMTLKGLVHPTQSMFARIIVNARINCILDAIDTTFFAPGGKHYDKKDIMVDYLKDIDRKLFCTSYHTVCALSESYELLIDPAEHTIKRALKALWDDSWTSNNKSQHYRQNKDALKDTTNATTAANAAPAQQQPQQQKKDDSGSALDCNYIKFKSHPNGPIEVLARKVRNKIPLLRDPYAPNKYSVPVIRKVITSWCDRQIMVHKYKFNSADQKKPLRTTSNSQKEMKMVATLGKEGDLYIHTGFLVDTDLKSPEQFIEDIIKDIFSRRHQIPHDFVWVSNPGKPHLRTILHTSGAQMQTIEVDGKIKKGVPFISIPSVVRLGDMERAIMKNIGNYVSEARKYETIPIETDLDSYAMNQKNKQLFIQSLPIDPKVMIENIIERVLRDEYKDMRKMAKEMKATDDKQQQQQHNEYDSHSEDEYSDVSHYNNASDVDRTHYPNDNSSGEQDDGDDDDELVNNHKLNKQKNQNNNSTPTEQTPKKKLRRLRKKSEAVPESGEDGTTNPLRLSLDSDKDEDELLFGPNSDVSDMDIGEDTVVVVSAATPVNRNNGNSPIAQQADDDLDGNTQLTPDSPKSPVGINLGTPTPSPKGNKSTHKTATTTTKATPANVIDDEEINKLAGLDPYDPEEAYFLGQNIDRPTVADDLDTLYNAKTDKLHELYIYLANCCKKGDILHDIDFDPQEFFVRRDEEGNNVYYWDVLAEQEKTEYLRGKRPIERCTFEFLRDEEESSLEPEELEVRKREILEHNVKRFKKICYHPVIFHKFQNEKYYKNVNTMKYPDDMLNSSSKNTETREERWLRTKYIGMTDEDIINTIKHQNRQKKKKNNNNNNQKQKDAQPQQSINFKLKTYSLSKSKANGVKKSKLFRNPKKSLVMVGNIVGDEPIDGTGDSDDRSIDLTDDQLASMMDVVEPVINAVATAINHNNNNDNTDTFGVQDNDSSDDMGISDPSGDDRDQYNVAPVQHHKPKPISLIQKHQNEIKAKIASKKQPIIIDNDDQEQQQEEEEEDSGEQLLFGKAKVLAEMEKERLLREQQQQDSEYDSEDSVKSTSDSGSEDDDGSGSSSSGSEESDDEDGTKTVKYKKPKYSSRVNLAAQFVLDDIETDYNIDGHYAAPKSKQSTYHSNNNNNNKTPQKQVASKKKMAPKLPQQIYNGLLVCDFG